MSSAAAAAAPAAAAKGVSPLVLTAAEPNDELDVEAIAHNSKKGMNAATKAKQKNPHLFVSTTLHTALRQAAAWNKAALTGLDSSPSERSSIPSDAS